MKCLSVNTAGVDSVIHTKLLFQSQFHTYLTIYYNTVTIQIYLNQKTQVDAFAHLLKEVNIKRYMIIFINIFAELKKNTWTCMTLVTRHENVKWSEKICMWNV